MTYNCIKPRKISNWFKPFYDCICSLDNHLQMAKHNFLNKSDIFSRSTKKILMQSYFYTLLWTWGFTNKNIRPKGLKRMSGHLKIVIQTANT